MLEGAGRGNSGKRADLRFAEDVKSPFVAAPATGRVRAAREWNPGTCGAPQTVADPGLLQRWGPVEMREKSELCELSLLLTGGAL